MTKVVFSYNTYRADENPPYRREYEGTKLNFNKDGTLIGVYDFGGKDIMITQVEHSDGLDCMKGTIDVREVVGDRERGIFYSNNDISPSLVALSKSLTFCFLSESSIIYSELRAGVPFDETTVFKRNELNKVDYDGVIREGRETVDVIGVEPNVFVAQKAEAAEQTKKGPKL